jgi:hypothetical protein
MFVYARAAIDYWPGWIKEQELKNQLISEMMPVEHGNRSISTYFAFLAKAQELARKIGWEGDIGSGPFIAGLPTHETASDGQYVIAWKQSNNGDTFVASPYRLPWLESGDYGRWIEG